MSRSWTPLVAAAFAFGLFACQGDTPSETAPIVAPVAPSSPIPEPPKVDPVETFAESLTTLSFIYAREENRARLEFSTISEPSLVFEGAPGRLDSADPRGHEASVECANEECSRATIRITLTRGSLAGTAVIARETPAVARTFQKSTPLGTRVTSPDQLTSFLAEFLNRENLTFEASLATYSLEGGGRTWFELRYIFLPTPIMNPSQSGYFDDKELMVLGRLGSKAHVGLVRESTREGLSTRQVINARASATLVGTPATLSIRFERPALGNPTLGVSLD